MHISFTPAAIHLSIHSISEETKIRETWDHSHCVCELVEGGVCWRTVLCAGGWHWFQGVINTDARCIYTPNCNQLVWGPYKIFLSSFSVSFICLRSAYPLLCSKHKAEGEMVDKHLWIWNTAAPLIYFYSIPVKSHPWSFFSSSIYFSPFIYTQIIN